MEKFRNIETMNNCAIIRCTKISELELTLYRKLSQVFSKEHVFFVYDSTRNDSSTNHSIHEETGALIIDTEFMDSLQIFHGV